MQLHPVLLWRGHPLKRLRDHGGRSGPPLPSSSEHTCQSEFSGCWHRQALTLSGKAERQAQNEEAQDQRGGKAHLSRSEPPAQSHLLPVRVPSLTPRPPPGAEQEAASSLTPAALSGFRASRSQGLSCSARSYYRGAAPTPGTPIQKHGSL